jgi:hypothetical protein
MSESNIRADNKPEIELSDVYDPVNGFGKLCPDCGRRFGDGAFIYHSCNAPKKFIMEEIAENAVRTHKFWR